MGSDMNLIYTLTYTIAALFLLGSCTTFHSSSSRELLPKKESMAESRIPANRLAKITTATTQEDLGEDEDLESELPHLLQDPNNLQVPQTVSEQEQKNLSEKFYFDWPVDDARMTRGFLPKKRRPHWGLDLAAPKGTPIFSAHKGTVIYAGKEFHGYGKMVLVESGHGWATLYAHLDKIMVSEGQSISQGDVVGAMGRTGRATGVHLHFEIRKDLGPVDPLPLLPDGEKIAQRG